MDLDFDDDTQTFQQEVREFLTVAPGRVPDTVL